MQYGSSTGTAVSFDRSGVLGVGVRLMLYVLCMANAIVYIRLVLLRSLGFNLTFWQPQRASEVLCKGTYSGFVFIYPFELHSPNESLINSGIDR